MFMFFGRGGRNFWILRLGLLALIFGAGAAFHYRGVGYWAVRGFYYLVIISFVLTAVWRNKTRQRGAGTRGQGTFGSSGYQGGGMQPPFGGSFPTTPRHGDLPPSVSPADRPPSVPVAEPATTIAPFPQAVPVEHSLLSAPGQQPGWYPDPSNPMARHYWDGTAWSHRLRWDGKTWVPA